MSSDRVAVQRDAVLLDALSQRGRPEAVDDPVVDLLAALVADVDRGLDDAVPADAPVHIPEQGPRRLVVALPLPPVGRRHVARAVAAAMVAAAVLSVGGVAAAVSGDPLTPYKSVINVVRGGYHEVIPHAREVGSAPKAKAAGAKSDAKRGAVEAARAASTARGADASRASRSAWRSSTGHRSWKRHQWDRPLADRHTWNRHMANSDDRGRHQWNGTSRYGDGRDGAGRDGRRGSGHDWRDSGEHGDGWDGQRR